MSRWLQSATLVAIILLAGAVSPAKAQWGNCPPGYKSAAGACVRSCPGGYEDRGSYCAYRNEGN
ncbi:MAG: hypothetical protein K2X71_10055 [Methylobacterium sp.]|jgi:hypothetical protein|uniref:hypothetical protein n=1 Tax=Methylobacterium sp. TaxID=409 RepID=UPI00258A4D5D|nr:hypothetical protein [Methylobacterium sp.]MBY0296367.1 hypothetical protein [Methylobacterium sp.]